MGESFATAIHPNAILGHGARIEAGAMICAGAIVGVGALVGRHAILNTGCSVDHHNDIGAFVHMAPGCRTGGEVVVEEGVLVGLSACLLPRIRIGAWSVIGAVAYGQPCRVIAAREGY
jgi:UDP-3-O-[3-hydroxymyristoyl] glucosamine N-acyltransferase